MAEYGMAVVFALCLFAIYAYYQKEINLLKAGVILVLSCVVVAVYFLLRWQAVGILPSSMNSSTGYFLDFYVDPEELGVKVFLYTLTANLLSTFMPIFDQGGVISEHSVLLIMIGIIMFGIYFFLLSRYSTNPVIHLIALVLFYYLLVESKNLIQFFLDQKYAFALSFSLHSILTLSIFFLFSRWRSVSKPHKLISIYAVGLILGASLVSFVYFRWRTHYLSIMGWLILMVIGLHYIRSLKLGRELVVSLMLIALVMTWKQTNILNSHLPDVTVEKYQHCLCHSSVPDDVVSEFADYYQIDLDELLPSCENIDWETLPDC